MTLAEAEVLDALSASPGDFAAVALGHDHWHVPEAIMDAIAQPRARVAVKSCHASSKTFAAADIALWAVANGNLVVTTAPTGTQVEKIMWPEINRAYAHARMALGGRCLTTYLEIGTGSALGISTDQADRLQGFHAHPECFLLVIVDEAPGLRPELWAAIEGMAAGGDVRILAQGNPTVASGPYYDMFADLSFAHFTIDAFDTPNLAGLSLEDLLRLPEHELDHNVRPYLVTRRWVKERYETWGIDSPEWQSRVRGRFPDQGEDALIARSWILEAIQRQVVVPPEAPYSAGLDVAGPGDDETVLAIRQGPRMVSLQAWHEADTGRLLGALLQALTPYLPRLAALAVDATGIGYHLAGSLAALRPDLRVLPINAGARPSEPARFTNLKAELFWSLRERFRTGLVAGPLDALTQAQLVALRWHVTLRGLIEIERKDELRRRGVPSPDRAEALMLACAADLFAARQQMTTLNFSGGKTRDLSDQIIRVGG